MIIFGSERGKTKVRDLSIVIPCYNESSRGKFQQRIDKLISFMQDRTSLDFEIIFVDDGSTDDTLEILKSNEREFIKIVSYRDNIGKAYALKRGINIAEGKYTLMMDADLYVPLEQIKRFYSYVSGAIYQHLAIAVRSRDTDKVKSLPRKFLSKAAHLSAKVLLGIPDVDDTQCGFKMFNTANVRKILPFMKSERWLFDIELIIYMQALGNRTKCFNVTIQEDMPSTINSFEALKSSIRELLVIMMTRRNTVKQISFL